MLTAQPTRLLEPRSESLTGSVKTDGEIIEADVEVLCYLARRFTLKIDSP
jgi:hypothetical protein